jgi:paraquat-inducible protein A
MHPENQYLHCPLCGQSHGVPSLKPGQRALCVQCGTTMAERGRLGPDAALVFALTGLFLAIPSLVLPFVTLEKFGKERTSLLTGGFEGLWSHGFGPLGAWVLFCGTVAPFGLLALLVAVLWTDRLENFHGWNSRFRQWAHAIQYWAMPEVQVLGVMVAFFKLGDVVRVSIEPGLWCYGAASLFTLLAWRRFSLQPRQERTCSIPVRASS